MSSNRPASPASWSRESLLFDPVLWLLIGFVLFVYATLPSPGLRRGEKAKVQVAMTQIEQFKTAAQLFQIDNGRTPKSLDELIHQPSDARNWKKYLEDLSEIPKDPWNNDYVYQSPGPRGEPFLITSYGRDGRSGTKDDITSNDGQDAKTGW